jgi:hypothetical protein
MKYLFEPLHCDHHPDHQHGDEQDQADVLDRLRAALGGEAAAEAAGEVTGGEAGVVSNECIGLLPSVFDGDAGARLFADLDRVSQLRRRRITRSQPPSGPSPSMLLVAQWRSKTHALGRRGES